MSFSVFRLALLAGALAVAGCAPASLQDTPTRAQGGDGALPPMKTFAAARPLPPVQSNANIAVDFLELHFELESGRDLPVFTRFETPITVRLTGNPTATMQADLSRLLVRLHREAGIDIRQTGGPQANVTIQAVTRDQIRRALPHAACFVVPNVTSIDEFRRNRRNPKTNWSLLDERSQLAVFLPSDASPQEVRDCLHEELAQAIGPLNDLYRLPQSVFNDDNVHTVLTGYDMLILRATYDPALHSGMTRDQVAARLPAILDRLNPRGAGLPLQPVERTPRGWSNAVQTALGPGTQPRARQEAALEASRIARQLAWQDHRRAFGHYILGRMIQGSDPGLAQEHFSRAMHFLWQTPGTDLHRAYVTAQTAAYAVATGQGERALGQIGPALAVAERSENAALLATLMLLQAEAYDLAGQSDRARTVRLDSLGWARYGFGSDRAVRAKMQEIAALNPRRNTDG